MGVLGLWQLLAPVGQPVTLESLENKIFAVDISIWLNQAIKGYRDGQGGSVPNAHLLSLFSRLCKLLFFKIRPVIVFDGGYPELKRQTIINRQQRRAAVKERSRDTGLKILTNYLASQNLAIAESGGSASKQIFKAKEKARDEIFKLPPLPEPALDGGYETSDSTDLIEWKFTNFSKEDIKYLNQIDINSEDFDNLPPDVKQEILSTLKESRKHRTWEQYAELPEESNEFSSYQMQCLLKKRNLSKKLEEVQKDLRKVNSADFISQYTNDHVIGETNKIMSDDTSHYVLLKKIIHKNESDDNKQSNREASINSMMETKNIFIKDMENIDIDNLNETENIPVTHKPDDEILINQLEAQVKQEIDFFDKYDEDEDIDDPTEIQYLNTQNLPSLTEKDKEKRDETIFLEQAGPSSSTSDCERTLKFNAITEQSKVSKDQSKQNSMSSVKMLNELPMPSDALVSDSHSASNSKSSATSAVQNNKLLENNEILIPVPHKEISKEPSSCDLHVAGSLLGSKATPNTGTSDIENNDIDICSSEDEFIPCEEIEDSFESMIPVKNKVITEKLCDSPSTKEQFISDQTSSIKNNSSLLNNSKNSTYDETNESPSTSSLPSTSKNDSLSKEEREAALIQLQNDLETATAVLKADQAKQDRQNRTVQEHMVEECKELLQLFGIPFIVSPTEAEAQCAFFDSANMTHGTITDDSDVWLFGGKRVYKNFFTQQKYVEFYKDTEIFNHFSLSRKKLINFAMLTGSDYTEGIDGVGRVTAMEILSEFPGDDIEALRSFKEWWTNANKNITTPDNKVRSKLKKLVLDWSFPDEKICDAYLNPVIDESTDRFTWGRPDLDALREYTRERFGWNKNKVDDALLPVIKKLNERESQTHLDNFFTVNLKKQTDLFPSKRIMSALKKMTSPQKALLSQKEEPNQNETKSAKRKSNVSRKKVIKKIKKKASADSKNNKPKVKIQGPILSEESSDEN